jgi:hypothetical protein
MGCESWAKLRERLRRAIDSWGRHEKSLPAVDCTPAQMETRRHLTDELFRAVSEIQQHEREHGCQNPTDASPSENEP